MHLGLYNEKRLMSYVYFVVYNLYLLLSVIIIIYFTSGFKKAAPQATKIHNTFDKLNVKLVGIIASYFHVILVLGIVNFYSFIILSGQVLSFI